MSYNNTITYNLYRQSLSFDLINDICFNNINNIINRETVREDNSVNIFYKENSLYIPDLSYNIEFSNNISKLGNLVYINNDSSDASMVIIYHLDFSNSYYTNINSIHGISFEQRSSDISLVLSYLSDASRPFISLSGEQIVKKQYNKQDFSYNDDGLNIYINNNHYLLDLSNEISMNLNSSENIISNNSNSINNIDNSNLFTDISSDVSVNNIGRVFDISYSYKIRLDNIHNNIFIDCSYNGNIIQSLTRHIIIEDDRKPTLLLLRDFSNIVDLSSGYSNSSSFNFDSTTSTNFVSIDDDKETSSFMNFSYTYNSNYSDLSKILFDISYRDNKSDNIDISLNFKAKVPPKTIFENTDSEQLKITLSNENYLSSDFSFIKTSKDIADNNPIEIKYILTDEDKNELNYIRKI